MKILLFALLVPSVAIKLSTPGCSQRCNKCEGGCSSNSDCAAGLKCFVRTTVKELVPGCEPTGAGDVANKNYCYEPCPAGTNPTAGCTGQLSNVLANGHSSCGISDGSLDIWVNTAVATNELYDMTSADMAITGALRVEGVITSTKTIAANARTATLAATATQLKTRRKIGGAFFDGTQDITPNICDHATTSGNAATATQLKTGRNIGGISFDGTQDITPNICVHAMTASLASSVTVANAQSNSNYWSYWQYVTFVNSYGTRAIQASSRFKYFPSADHLSVGAYKTTSDRRIKKNIESVPDHLALDMLRKLDVKYYNYLDKSHATERVIGFIAQEVAEVIPDAVNIRDGFIPFEMDYLSVKWVAKNEKYDMRVSKMLKPGKYEFVMDDKTGLTLETTDGYTFETNDKYSSVFLNAREIDDFHYIDKAKIFAVGYAAVQQVDKNQQVLQDKVQAQEGMIATLSSVIEEMAVRLAALEAK